jgi:hypothetical protein
MSGGAAHVVEGARMAPDTIKVLAETGMLVDSGMRTKRVSPESVEGERLPASVGWRREL